MTSIQIALAAWGFVRRVTRCRPGWCPRCATWVQHEAERISIERGRR